jgi:hypothetical protein
MKGYLCCINYVNRNDIQKHIIYDYDRLSMIMILSLYKLSLYIFRNIDYMMWYLTPSAGRDLDALSAPADAPAGHPQAGPHQAGYAARAGAAANDETTGESEEVLREKQD